jgi:hypothetical protein
MEIITKLRLICASLFKPFAGPKAVKSGMGPASEGNPTGYYH